MAFIKTVGPDQAVGQLARLYKAAVARAGKVFNVIRIQSARPRVLRASTQLYTEVMHSTESGLSRAQREMIATVVSRLNGCHYWTEEHGKDLRAEVHRQDGGEALVEAVMSDWRQADLLDADRAMLDFAARLTLEPATLRERHVVALRDRGFDDGAIHDVVQVTALFAYYNRLADGLGVDPEPET